MTSEASPVFFKVPYKPNPLVDESIRGCLICGKPLKHGVSKYAVWLIHGGENLAPMDDPSKTYDDDMGTFYVGGGCAKRIPKRYKSVG